MEYACISAYLVVIHDWGVALLIPANLFMVSFIAH